MVVVATNAALDKIQTAKLAAMAQSGCTRALSPAHTIFDGDMAFALSLGLAPADLNALGAAAADAVAAAIVRGVQQARSLGGVPGLLA